MPKGKRNGFSLNNLPKEHKNCSIESNEFQTNLDKNCSNCNINCFTKGYPFVIHWVD